MKKINKRISKFFTLLFFIGIYLPALAQPGTIDLTFNPTDPGFGFGDGPDFYVYTSSLQSNGKIIIGGEFTRYNGTAINRIARLNTDGSLDVSFNPGTGADNIVRICILQPDGKIIIGGSFSSYNGTSRNGIARLNSDGSLDVSFIPGSGANGDIRSIRVLPDGKFIIGGEFISYNGTAIRHVARLNSDGTLDTGFNTGTGPDNGVFAITLQPDNKIIIGGAFSSYNGTARNGIARLNADGIYIPICTCAGVKSCI